MNSGAPSSELETVPTVRTRGIPHGETGGTSAPTPPTAQRTPPPTAAALTLPSSPAPASRGMGLRTKFFLAAALLLTVTLGLAIAVATWRANVIAERTIREALQRIPNLFAVYRSNLETQLKASLRSIADDPGTKALIDSTTNPETIIEYTRDKANVLHAKTVFLFDRGGQLIGRSDWPTADDSKRDFRTVKWVAEPLDTWVESSAIIRQGSALSVVASVPVLAGDKERGEATLVGVLAAAIALDEKHAESLRVLTGGQVGFLANTAKRGSKAVPAVAAATRNFGGTAFVAALSRSPGAPDELFEAGREIGPIDLAVLADKRIVAGLPLKSAAGETLGAFVVSRSRDEEMAAFQQIRMALIAIGLVALVASIPVSLALGRRIARPLEDLAAGAVAIRDGNLDVVLPAGGRDEVGALARAFVAMVGELREKAQLEELLSEMQRRPGDVTHVSAGQTAVTQGMTTLGGLKPGQLPRVGELFAERYEILSTLGRGGMGAVYRALDRELEDDVALKVLLPEAFEEGTVAVQTLKQEIRLARKITHQNVVRTHDLGERGGVRFLTMEYVPGTTLREVIDRRGSIAIAPGLQVAKQLSRGLAAVHEAGIIHRDIKPQNIMVLPNGVVKLMDFGIARTAEGVDPNAVAGQTVGTPYYMSPEQAQGKNLDSQSDVYSVGVVLYELFTGTRPFEGKDPMAVMRKHVGEEPPPPRRLRPDLPDSIERILLACLAKKKERRPAGAADLYAALMAVGAATSELRAV